MSTDLRRALRDAVADEPTFVVEPRVLAHTGTHRLRRRNALVVGVAPSSRFPQRLAHEAVGGSVGNPNGQ